MVEGVVWGRHMKTFFLDFSMGHQLSHKSAACKTPPSAKHEVTQRESVPCEANRSEEQRPLSSAHPDHAGQAAPGPRRWMVGMPSAVSNEHTCLVWSQWRNTLPHTTGSPRRAAPGRSLWSLNSHILSLRWVSLSQGLGTIVGSRQQQLQASKAVIAFSRQEKCLFSLYKHNQGFFSKRKSFPEALASSKYPLLFH